MKQSFRFLLWLVFCLSAVCVHAAEEDRRFRVINASSDLADNSSQVVVCTKTGRMIICTIGNLNFFDGSTFRHIDTRVEIQYALPEYRGNCHLYFDHSHHIWLKRKGHTTCVDLLTEMFIANVDSVFQSMGYNEPVLDLFVDATGTLWTLTPKGLQDAEHGKLFRIPTDCNLQDVDVMGGMLLLFYDNGREVGLDLETGQMLHTTQAYGPAIAAQYANSSVILPYGDGYYQLRNGDTGSILMYFNVKSQIWQTIIEQPYHMNNLTLHEDKIYIPNSFGYSVLNPATGELEHVKMLTLTDGSSLYTDCNDLEFDRQGGMWIGSELRGLLYASQVSSPFKVYSLDDPVALKYAEMMDSIPRNLPMVKGVRANCHYTDSRGWTWLGTTSGLYLYKTPYAEPIVFSKRNGLFNDVVHSVVEGKRHNIWVATSRGISCILFKGDEIDFVNSFNENDNVPCESFLNGRAICLDDSTIVMQALDHVVAFKPTDLDFANRRRPYKLYPKLIRLLVNGTEVGPNDELDGVFVVDRAVARCQDINLASNHSSVLLMFSGLNYYRPYQTYYRVHLVGDGIDKWEECSYFSGQHKVDDKGLLHYPLYGLEAGDYELTVEASMFPDQWDDDETYTWRVHVGQPWWRSIGLYLLIGIAILVLGGYNLTFFSRNTRMKLRRNHEERDVIEKIKSFVDRCDAFESEMLLPSQEEFLSVRKKSDTQMSPEFMSLMNRLMPFVREHQNGGFSMHQLSKVGGVDLTRLYEIITPYIHKNPRELVRFNRVQKAAELLKGSSKSMAEIAAECGFYTPNYLAGCFFHQYKQTPYEYRTS